MLLLRCNSGIVPGELSSRVWFVVGRLKQRCGWNQTLRPHRTRQQQNSPVSGFRNSSALLVHRPYCSVHSLATGNGEQEGTIHAQIFARSRHQQCATVAGLTYLYNERQTVAPSPASGDDS
jgi:hypothetical protein